MEDFPNTGHCPIMEDCLIMGDCLIVGDFLIMGDCPVMISPSCPIMKSRFIIADVVMFALSAQYLHHRCLRMQLSLLSQRCSQYSKNYLVSFHSHALCGIRVSLLDAGDIFFFVSGALVHSTYPSSRDYSSVLKWSGQN